MTPSPIPRPRSKACAALVLAGLVLAGLVLGVAAPASAQRPSASASFVDHQAWLSGGWDHTWFVEGGLARTFVMTPGTLALCLDVTAGAPPLLVFPLTGWRSGAGATLQARGPFLLGVDATAHTGLSLSNDVTSSRVNLNTQLSVRPGVYGSFFSLGVEVLATSAVLSHVVHHDVVQDLFDDRYPNASAGTTTAPGPGWVVWPATTLRAGGFGGLVLFDTFAVTLNGGIEVIPQKQAAVFIAMLGQLGFYSILTAGVSW